MSSRRGFLRGALCLGAASTGWAAGAHLLFSPSADDMRNDGPLPTRVRAMLEHQLGLWEGDGRAEIEAMRRFNPEWDLMGRTFLVLALADIALRLPAEQDRLVAVMDTIIGDTLAAEASHGINHYLLSYGHSGGWHSRIRKSVFVEGEIGVMLGARRAVREHAGTRAQMLERIEAIHQLMDGGPVKSGESYPDECWTFCNAMALVALRLHEHLDGADHRVLRSQWVQAARQHLVHQDSGLLVSSYHWDGTAKDGPEGSTIWLTAKSLLLVDRELAQQQYELARRELRGGALGFGWAGEWPASWRGPMDIDSGAVIPILQASPASSGHAVAAARAFGDVEFYRELLASLELVGFPESKAGRLRYRAGNQVGDAVLLHGMVQGPLWSAVGGGA